MDNKFELVKKCVLEGHKDRVWNIAWSPNGKYLASCGGDKAIHIWGEENGEWKLKGALIDQHQRTIRKISWSPNGEKLAAARYNIFKFLIGENIKYLSFNKMAFIFFFKEFICHNLFFILQNQIINLIVMTHF